MINIKKDADNLVGYVGQLKAAGGAAAKAVKEDLPATAGIFADQYEEWAPGAAYTARKPIQYKGMAYQVQQDVTALENQPPDMEGMLAIYTPYPAPNREGHYPYTYGMHVEAGMLEIDPNGKLYEAISGMATQLNPPSELPAIFQEVP